MSRSFAVTRRVLKPEILIWAERRAYSAPPASSIPESKQKFVPKSGRYPKGFSVSGTYVGIKESNKKIPDLALIVSESPCVAAAVFTTNQFKAAPVLVSKAMLDRRHGEGITNIIVNAGCANAVTGKGGDKDALAMAQTATARCNPEAPADDRGHRSIVMSTGVIGQRLPIQKILDKIPDAHSNLASTHKAWLAAARAICTTDTFPKLLSTTFTLPGPEHKGITYSLAGMAKGAGMIHPNMATLLAILCTDCPINPQAANFLLGSIADQSFNSISVDGDTSTNDTLALLANGAANKRYAGGDKSQAITLKTQDETFIALSKVLTSFAQQLSHLVVRDGEGATKFVEVHVRNAYSQNEAHNIAESIARSPLVKTALYGKDANWGRILCAIGYARDAKGSVDPKRTSVSFVPTEQSKSREEGVLKLLVEGEPQAVDEARAARLLEDEDLKIDVDLATGEREAKYWFCDFSHEYVTINGDYRT